MQSDEQVRPVSDGENVVFQGDPNVAPAGYKRDEQMAERKDDLQQKAEEMNKQVEIGSIDPTSFAPDREILHAISGDALTVSDRLPDYEYKWVRDVNNNGGPSNAVLKEIARTVVATDAHGKKQVYPTWEVVRGEMPEAIVRKTAMGTRQVGDVILLRCHKNTYAVIQQQEELKKQAQEDSVVSALEDKAERVGAPMHNYTQAQASQLAKNQFNSMIKTGSVPGMPGPGR